MDEVLQLEGDMVQLHVRPGEEVHAVMVWIAAHETEEIADPVGDAKAENLLVESDRALDIRSKEGDMAELERSDPGDLLVLAQIAPVLEQLDDRSLVVGKREHLPHAGSGIVAQLAADALACKLFGHVAEIGIGRDFERQLEAVRPIRLVERDDELADLAGEEGAILLALGEEEAHELLIIGDRLVEIGGLEGGMSDASCSDHGVLLLTAPEISSSL